MKTTYHTAGQGLVSVRKNGKLVAQISNTDSVWIMRSLKLDAQSRLIPIGESVNVTNIIHDHAELTKILDLIRWNVIPLL